MIRLFIESGGSIRFLQNNKKMKKKTSNKPKKFDPEQKIQITKKTAIYFEMQL